MPCSTRRKPRGCPFSRCCAFFGCLQSCLCRPWRRRRMAGTLHRRRQARPQCSERLRRTAALPTAVSPWACSMDAGHICLRADTTLGEMRHACQCVRRRQDGVRVLDAGEQLQGSLLQPLCTWLVQAPSMRPCMRALMWCSDAMATGTHDCAPDCTGSVRFPGNPGSTVSAASRVPPQGCPLAGCLHKGKNQP